MSKIVAVYKPKGPTSHDIIDQIRKITGVKKVGHAGTLDPLATGLLIICTGKMTKRIDSFQGQEKEYTGTIVLGSTTPSFDLETEINETFQTQHITEALIHETTKQFIGNIQQFPPIFSAVKKNGKRLYEFARAGEHVEIKLREVNISEFAITKIDLPEVQFRVVCSKGTYIRSLAHDFGKALNSGAHLSVLRRTKIGGFSVENALSVEEFIQSLKN